MFNRTTTDFCYKLEAFVISGIDGKLVPINASFAQLLNIDISCSPIVRP